MVLFLENYEYLRGWTNGNGAHLVVHDRNTVPLVEQDGVAISGGTETFIGLKRVTNNTLYTSTERTSIILKLLSERGLA